MYRVIAIGGEQRLVYAIELGNPKALPRSWSVTEFESESFQRGLKKVVAPEPDVPLALSKASSAVAQLRWERIRGLVQGNSFAPFDRKGRGALLKRHAASIGTTLVASTVLATCNVSSGAPTGTPTGPGAALTVTCEQTRGFHDGDTFTCVTAGTSSLGETFVVRVAGVDAPEMGQARWRSARDRLRELAGPGTAVSCYKEDRYHRAVCRVRTADGGDVVATLIQEGLAWHAVEYAHEQTAEERGRYSAAERDAKAKHLGLWQESNPQPPWECRRARLERARCR